jgi:hypothetical protein
LTQRLEITFLRVNYRTLVRDLRYCTSDAALPLAKHHPTIMRASWIKFRVFFDVHNHMYQAYSAEQTIFGEMSPLKHATSSGNQYLAQTHRQKKMRVRWQCPIYPTCLLMLIHIFTHDLMARALALLRLTRKTAITLPAKRHASLAGVTAQQRLHTSSQPPDRRR